jgi:glycosyltransferase involved in cell wall biosynthesis
MSARPLRILHVDKFGSRSGGGATGYMLEVIGRQRSRGHHVEFLATDGPTDLDTGIRHLFPPRPTLDPPPNTMVGRARTTAHMVWARSAQRAMEQALVEVRPDIVHCHNLYHQLTPSVLRPVRRAGIPVVMTVHDYKLVCPTYRLVDGEQQHCEACVDGSVVNVVRRRCQGGSRMQSAALMVESGLHRRFGAYGPIDTFLCPSTYMAELLRRGGFGERVEHLPYGYDLQTIAPRTTTGAGIVFGGRLSREKGVDHLIEAVRLIDDVALTICGDGPLRDELEHRGREALGSRVSFLGHLGRSELLDRFRSAAVVAVPSVWAENQPLSVIEAMACGTPVVAGDSPALQEMVIPGISGTTVDPRDHRALAAALERFVRDVGYQASISASTRANVERVHEMEAHLDRLEHLYGQHIRRRA